MSSASNQPGNIQFQFDGILKEGGYKKWVDENDKDFKNKYSSALKRALDESKNEGRQAIRSRFKLTGKAFENAAIRSEIYDSDKSDFAAGHIFSKVYWYHTHEEKTDIKSNKNLIIPIVQVGSKFRRRNKEAFKKLLEMLFTSGDFFYKKTGKNTILFAKLTKANSSALSVEKKFFNRNNTTKVNGKIVKTANYKKLGEGDYIPVGVCIPVVHLKKRYNLSENLDEKTRVTTIKYFEENVKKG